MRRRCADMLQDAVLSAELYRPRMDQAMLNRIKPLVTDAAYPATCGDSGVPDSDQLMIAWRLVCGSTTAPGSNPVANVNRGLETLQENKLPSFSTRPDTDSRLIVIQGEGQTITATKQSDGRSEHQNHLEQREENPGPGQITSMTPEEPSQVTPDKHKTAEFSPILVTEPDGKWKLHVRFSPEALRQMRSVVAAEQEALELRSRRAAEEAIKAAGGLLPVFGPAPLGLPTLPLHVDRDVTGRKRKRG
ncbi:hypothetical protein CAC42_3635 [Sphaceloma murrayae]|uniref:Uncharacterized protein n=1 Tax=Sphaceloma murrayae TaxID=2082308 RepID=A0A2K1QPQ7_9PEZI|nr:hypothetical protein CAC42_3635 [Sphaceloma murrayae]